MDSQFDELEIAYNRIMSYDESTRKQIILGMMKDLKMFDELTRDYLLGKKENNSKE